MKIAFFLMMVIGVAIGFAVPTGHRAAPVPPTVAAMAPPADKPVETVIDRSDNGHFITVADVNGEPIRFVIDTGASMVALTREDATRAHVAFDPQRFDVIGQGASGAVRGQMVTLDTVVLDGKRVAAARGAVVEGLTVSLLGQTYLAKLDSVEISHDKMRLR